MQEEHAIEILRKWERDGAHLAVAGKGDFRVIKRMLSQCLDAEIPAMLGPCKVQG
jgi:hypothetical protein